MEEKQPQSQGDGERKGARAYVSQTRRFIDRMGRMIRDIAKDARRVQQGSEVEGRKPADEADPHRAESGSPKTGHSAEQK